MPRAADCRRFDIRRCSRPLSPKTAKPFGIARSLIFGRDVQPVLAHIDTDYGGPSVWDRESCLSAPCQHPLLAGRRNTAGPSLVITHGYNKVPESRSSPRVQVRSVRLVIVR